VSSGPHTVTQYRLINERHLALNDRIKVKCLRSGRLPEVHARPVAARKRRSGFEGKIQNEGGDWIDPGAEVSIDIYAGVKINRSGLIPSMDPEPILIPFQSHYF